MPNSIPEREGHAASPRADAWYQVTLAAIGDAVMTADPDGLVTYINPVAETLTGWSAAEALGKQLGRRLPHRQRRDPEAHRAAGQEGHRARGSTVGLGNHTLLIARDGSERPIDDSAAAVRDERGAASSASSSSSGTSPNAGRPSGSSSRPGRTPRASWPRCGSRSSSSTGTLHVRSANRSFYETFRVDPARGRRPIHLRPRGRPVGHPGA